MLDELLRQASLTVHTGANLLRRLATNPWLWGAECAVVIPAGETSGSTLHGLGRAMNGAVVIGATDASRTVSVDISNDTTSVTARISAVSGADFTVRLRVY